MTTAVRCECGNWFAEDGDWTQCTMTVGPSSRFAQGHDAKLKGWLILCDREGLKVRRGEDGELMDAKAAGFQISNAIGAKVAAGIERPAKKEQAAEELFEQAIKANRVRVGRWWYKITRVDGERFTYITREGKLKTTTVVADEAESRLKAE